VLGLEKKGGFRGKKSGKRKTNCTLVQTGQPKMGIGGPDVFAERREGCGVDVNLNLGGVVNIKTCLHEKKRRRRTVKKGTEIALDTFQYKGTHLAVLGGGNEKKYWTIRDPQGTLRCQRSD